LPRAAAAVWLIWLPLLFPASALAAESALVHHVETLDGVVIDSGEPDRAINPASVVKLATTLWALEKLGPDFCFETVVAATGTLDEQSGTLEGDLWIVGGGDPDFHVENSYLLAARLNQLGISRVEGRLHVDERFWIGWEGGSERKTGSGARRSALMGRRLLEAWDPKSWDDSTREGIDAFRLRRGLTGESPTVIVTGKVVTDAVRPLDARELLRHRSKPLVHVLKRFNAYSNNDIERLSHTLGGAEALRVFLAERWECECPELRFATLSGLGSNRMSSRQVVRLLRDLQQSCAAHDLRLDQLMPVVGCDPGTLEAFEKLTAEAPSSVVAKTGTLIRTDGGTSIVAGLLRAVDGPRLFSLSIPRSGGAVGTARRREEARLLQLIAASGGALAEECPEVLRFPDEGAAVLE